MSTDLAPRHGLRPLCTHYAKAKVTYPSELAAQAAGVYYAQGTYKCKFCPGWHLTSRGRKTHNKRAAYAKARRLVPQGHFH
jgi:hypothetical protein